MSPARPTLAAVALVAALALAGCSSTSGSSGSMPGMDHGSSPMSSAPAADAAFNKADVGFASGMVPHHTQAVSMVDTLLAKEGVAPSVIALAEKIKAEQAREIATMTSWLEAWKVPASSYGMAMGDGMMSESDTTALKSATGADAARLFIAQMTQHHEGAIRMAASEASDGKYPDAVALSKSIVASQTAEVATMKELLASL